MVEAISEEVRGVPLHRPSKVTAKGRNGGHKSTDNREAALGFAQVCYEKFSEPVTSLEDIEKN